MPDAPGAPAPDKFPFTPRWAAVVPTALIAGGIAVFTVFFMDGLVERALEKAGTAANGAQVELDGVDISLRMLSVTLERLQVTNADEPMTNALEVGRMTMKLAPKPLAWKKIVVEDASIDGVRTGTPRKSSGALRKRPAAPGDPSAPAAEEGPGMAEKAASLGLAAWDNLKDKYDPKKIQPEDLASYRKVKEEQVHLQAVADTWDARIDAVKTSDVEARVKAFADKVKNESFSGIEGVQKAQNMLKEAKALKNDVEATSNGFKALKKDLAGEIDRAKGSLKEIDALRKQDVDGALGEAKEAVSVGGVTQGLLGPQYSAKLRQALGMIRKIRAKIPQKKEGAEAPPPPARTGVDILFPFRHSWPTFHLVKAGLTGQTGTGRDYSGTIKDVSSEPKKVPRPIALAVAGEKSREFSLTAELDYRTDVPREKVSFLYGGIPLAGMKLGEAGAPIVVASGAGRVTADIEAKGEALSGAVLFVAEPVALSHALTPEQAKNKLLSLLHDVLAKLTRADVAFKLSGRLSSPHIKVESSLDGQVKDAVKQAVEKELEALKAQAAARVAQLVDGEKQKLEALVNGKSGEALKKIGLKDKQVAKAEEAVRKALDDLQKKGTAGVLPTGDDGKPKLPGDLKKLFKRK